MPKKKSPIMRKHSHGVVMTDEGLLIPGRLLRKMGEEIVVSFSSQLIVISSRTASSPVRKPKRTDRRSLPEDEDIKGES
jgi:hypothetical protein